MKYKIGKPIYKIGDTVCFELIMQDGNAVTLIGKIEIVDRYGTFEQNDEPSYDIMVENWCDTNERMLVKHIRESHLESKKTNRKERQTTMPTKNKKISVSAGEFGAFACCSVRYCLGRQTYMPSLITGYLKPILKDLPTNDLQIIQRDVENANNYGNEKIDKPCWESFLQAVQEELEKRGKNNDEL